MNAVRNSGSLVNPTLQISWGEFVDKLTILQIKEERLLAPEAVANVRRELAQFNSASVGVVSEDAKLSQLAGDLKIVNEVLWEIEDKIRAKEAAQCFDREFIDLARSVYFQNDRRNDVKRRINKLLNSEIVEEKQYTEYTRQALDNIQT